jgi:hypothetical protein
MVAAADGDLDALADRLGASSGFEAPTIDALRAAPDPHTRLALALVSPEVVLA